MCSLIFSFGLTIHLHWSAVAVVPVTTPTCYKGRSNWVSTLMMIEEEMMMMKMKKKVTTATCCMGRSTWLAACAPLPPLEKCDECLFPLAVTGAIKRFDSSPSWNIYAFYLPTSFLFFMIVNTFACSTNWCFEDVMALLVSFLCIFHPVCYMDWREGSCRG